MKRKEYTAKIEILTNELQKLEDWIQVVEESNGEVLEDIETWNDLYDRETELKQAIKVLRYSWDRRNWTVSDFETARLIAENID